MGLHFGLSSAGLTDAPRAWAQSPVAATLVKVAGDTWAGEAQEAVGGSREGLTAACKGGLEGRSWLDAREFTAGFTCRENTEHRTEAPSSSSPAPGCVALGEQGLPLAGPVSCSARRGGNTCLRAVVLIKTKCVGH